MTLNDLYLISQIAAVALVIPTLFYLALQVRQNTAQLRATSRYQFVEATGQMNTVAVSNRQVASVFGRGMKDYDRLNEDEKLQFLIFVGHYFQIYSTMFELHADGLLPDSQWHHVQKDILALLKGSGGKKVWNDFAKTGLGPDFVAFVDSLAESKTESYHFGDFYGAEPSTSGGR